MRHRWVGAAIIGGMILYTMAVWSGLPDQIPTHWSFGGEVNRYAARWPGAFLVPGIALAVWLLMPFLRRVDPRREHYEQFDATFYLLINVIVSYLCVIHVLVLGSAMGWGINVSRAIIALIGVSFIAIGNVLPRLRSNWWMGIRTPWTLESERVWRETHRLAGWTFVAGGLVSTLAMFLPADIRFPTAMAALIGGALVPVIYSYVLWRRYGGDSEASSTQEG